MQRVLKSFGGDRARGEVFLSCEQGGLLSGTLPLARLRLATRLRVVAVERSTNLVNWLPLRTNTLGVGVWYFSDPASRTNARGFYRARVVQ